MENEYVNEVHYEPNKTDGLAVASMVLGILSLVCCCAWYLSIILSVLGLIFGLISIRTASGSNKGMAIAGIATSSVCIALLALALIFGGIGVFSSYFETMKTKIA